MGFSRQEYWNGLPFPSPGDLPDPGIEPRSPALQTDALPSEPPRKPICRLHIWKFIYLIKFICKTKSTLGVFPWLSMEMHRWAKSLNCPKDTFPAKAGNNFLLYPLYYKQTFFLSNFLVPVFQFFLFFFWWQFPKNLVIPLMSLAQEACYCVSGYIFDIH